MSIYSAMRSLKKSKAMAGLRPYLNLLYHDPETVIINKHNFDYVEVDGCKFHMSDQIDSIQRVVDNPWFQGVRMTDIVLDIGANIGAITIPLAQVAKDIYAVEPLFQEELAHNIMLNGLAHKVTIFPYAIGRDGDKAEVEFSSKKAVVRFKSLDSILKIIGSQVNFIKIDGEGCEWDIEPKQLKGIREIRIEFHLRRGKKMDDQVKLARYMEWFRDEGYEVHSYWSKIPLCTVFSRCLVLRASLVKAEHSQVRRSAT